MTPFDRSANSFSGAIGVHLHVLGWTGEAETGEALEQRGRMVLSSARATFLARALAHAVAEREVPGDLAFEVRGPG